LKKRIAELAILGLPANALALKGRIPTMIQNAATIKAGGHSLHALLQAILVAKLISWPISS
jgi:hypothetical protein